MAMVDAPSRNRAPLYALAALGVKAGDRVAIVLPQRPETAIAYIAIFQMGAVALPLSYLFGPEALEYRLSHAGACVAIVDPGPDGRSGSGQPGWPRWSPI